MLAPVGARSRSTESALSPRSPSEFEVTLTAARLEALALLRDLLHAPFTSAAETRERRLAATAILRIPAPDLIDAPPERADDERASPIPAPAAPPPAPAPRAQTPVSPKPAAHTPAAAPLSPRPARPQISRLVSAAGADSS